MLQGLLETQAVQALLRKRAIHRAYKRTVDEHVAVLFCGFPNNPLSSLSSLTHPLGQSRLIRQGEAMGTEASVCAVQVAVLLVRKIIGGLSQQERQDLARAFLTNDASNPIYKGFKCMFQIVEQLHVAPAFVSYLNIEVAGALRGMSQKEIYNSWIEGQIGSVMGRLRERCLEEAEFKRDLWQ
jgi:hypothetical protein